MSDQPGGFAETSKYVQLKRYLDKRQDYIDRAILALQSTPPIKGESQDTIIVSRESMVYVLERAMEAVKLADELNEIIQRHNMPDTPHPSVF